MTGLGHPRLAPARPPAPRKSYAGPARLFAAALGILLWTVGAAGTSAAEPAPAPVVEPVPAFTITDARITESSGLARDLDNTVFWTANDSGDGAVVFALGPDGRTKGTLQYDASPEDVEALAYADGKLYVADIGDNSRNRRSVQVYVFDNPVPGQRRGSNYSVYDLVYPDRPHDAEAIVVDQSGRLFLVTKDAPGVIYRAPRQLSTRTQNRLTRVAEAPAYVTDGTILSSGRFALRTYKTAEILEPRLFGPVARGSLPFQPQGESITSSVDDQQLLIGSEGVNSQVMLVPVPTELLAAPRVAPTPPPSPSPSATPEADPADGGAERTGTLVALGLALLMSIAAGLVVYLRDRGTEVPVRPVPVPRRQWEGQSDTDNDRTVIRPR